MDFAKYFSVALASAIKFVGGPITGAALRLNWWETALFTMVGMMSAVTIVSLVGREIQRRIRARSSAQVKLFSRRTRLAVSVWRRFGLWGIACLTPLFFTPIGGTLIALSFKLSLRQFFLPMLVFAALWAIIFSLLIYNIPAVKTFVS